MEKQTKAKQEIINRIANQKHFLKEKDLIMNWTKINKVLSKVEIKRESVAGKN
ncbi:MAG: hypothetical protein ABFD01_06910 [Candidatus Cloacimonas sp.]|jgi:hypothetical protein